MQAYMLGVVEVHVCAYMLGVVEVQTSAQEVLHICVSVPVMDVSILVLKDPLCLPSLLLEKLNKTSIPVGLQGDVGDST